MSEPIPTEPFGVEVVCTEAFHDGRTQRVATFIRALDGSPRIEIVVGARRNEDGTIKRPSHVLAERQVSADGTVRLVLACTCGLRVVRKEASMFPFIDQRLRGGVDTITLKELN